MADHDWRTGAYGLDPQGRGNFNAQQEDLKGQQFTTVRYFDASAVGMASGDTFKICTIDAGVLVQSIKILTATAEGGTCTFDVGDSSSGTVFDDGIDINATAGTLEATSTLAYKFYSAANYLLLTMNNAAATAKFYVIVDCLRLA